MHEFVENNFTSARMALVGLGRWLNICVLNLCLLELAITSNTESGVDHSIAPLFEVTKCRKKKIWYNINGIAKWDTETHFKFHFPLPHTTDKSCCFAIMAHQIFTFFFLDSTQGSRTMALLIESHWIFPLNVTYMIHCMSFQSWLRLRSVAATSVM